MSFFLIFELAVIAIFFMMFLRGSKFVWGVGLLTVSSAVLLNEFLNVFGREQTITDMGLWYNVIGGLLFAGAALWLWGIIRPHAVAEVEPEGFVYQRPTRNHQTDESNEELLSRRAASMSREVSPYDRQLLYNQIYQNLSPDDILDLIFDMDLVENEVVSPTNDMSQTIINVMDTAYEEGRMSDLALAVERILTPVPPDHFPRLERLNEETPSTVLRRYLLAFYFLGDLQDMAAELDIDWERLGLGSKQMKVRNLLLYLKRRGRLAELLDLMKSRVGNK